MDAGLAHPLHHDGQVTYGAADQPHHHVACRSCGQVAPIEAGRLAAVLAELQRAGGYRLDAGGLVANGTCPGCQTR